MSDRAETGTMQFGDDWPGVFIRGDNAGYMAMQISMALEATPGMDPVHRWNLQAVARDLQCCIVVAGVEPEDLQRMKRFDACVKQVADHD